MLAASLAAAPRPLLQTLQVAMAYGINIEAEGHYLWLADLALSLPVPVGWVQREHPTNGMPYWYNEICDSAQWVHPVDDFIKATIKMQRMPLSPQVQVMRRAGFQGRRRGSQSVQHDLVDEGKPGSTVLGNSFRDH